MNHTKNIIPKILAGVVFASLFAASGAYAQPPKNSNAKAVSLQPNQTLGFSDNDLVKFTYTQNFDCVDQAKDDLNYNMVLAQSDPGEFQTPICQPGTKPTIDPTGAKPDPQDFLYVLIPMFSLNDDQNPNDAIPCIPEDRLNTLCGPALGKTLIKLFGAIPEAYKAKPMVFTDCPNPGSPPGTCTMHTSQVDLGKVLTALGKLPKPAKNVFLPTPNHSHLITAADANVKPIWWEVIPVLVTKYRDWPSKYPGRGITSIAKLRDEEREGDAIEVPSNFFLFFSSHKVKLMRDSDGDYDGD